MKPKDIKPGVVYGYKPGKYDVLRPVLIVDNTYWRRSGRSFGVPKDSEPAFYSLDEYDAARRAERPDARPMERGFTGGDSFPDCGLPGIDFGSARVMRYGNEVDARGERAATLAALDPAKALKMFRALKGSARTFRQPEGARAHLFSPAFIVGEWAEVYGDEQDELARRANLEAEALAESRERIARATKRVEALRALGLPGEIADPQEHNRHNYSGDWTPPRYSGNTDRVVLSMRQVDALLSLIPDGAQWREEDVEEDGWTLRRPEYDEEAEEDDDDDES